MGRGPAREGGIYLPVFQFKKGRPVPSLFLLLAACVLVVVASVLTDSGNKISEKPISLIITARGKFSTTETPLLSNPHLQLLEDNEDE